MATKPTKGKTISFAFERETKNTIRYQEVVEGMEVTTVGTLYVSKVTFQGMDAAPQELIVSIGWK